MNTSVVGPEPLDGRRRMIRFLLGSGFGASIVAFLYPALKFMMPPTVAESAVNQVSAGKVAELKRTYYRTCLRLLEELKREKRLRRLDPRLAALSLFGMVNWIYTWYNPRVDPQAQDLAEKMAAIFFSGVLTGAAPGPRNHRPRPWAGS